MSLPEIETRSSNTPLLYWPSSITKLHYIFHNTSVANVIEDTLYSLWENRRSVVITVIDRLPFASLKRNEALYKQATTTVATTTTAATQPPPPARRPQPVTRPGQARRRPYRPRRPEYDYYYDDDYEDEPEYYDDELPVLHLFWSYSLTKFLQLC